MYFLKMALTILITLVSLQCQAANADPVKNTSALKSDEYYMQMAIDLAKNNPKAPFAAVIIDHTTGRILGKGVNATDINPTFHGEMVAINDCIKNHPNVNWEKVTLYTTAEPCSMCQSATVWTKIPRVVYATSLDYLISHGWQQINIHASEINAQAPFYRGSVEGGVLASKANKLFQKSAAKQSSAEKSC